MTDMRRINLTRKSKPLHVEAPGCIVNITPGLTDQQGRPVVHISVGADGDRYAGDVPWWINGEKGNAGHGLRVVRGEGSAPEAGEVRALKALLLRVLNCAEMSQDDMEPETAALIEEIEEAVGDEARA
jgi:hypothetical protein